MPSVAQRVTTSPMSAVASPSPVSQDTASSWERLRANEDIQFAPVELPQQDIEALLARVTTSDSAFEWKTIPQGAATTCWAATSPELEGKGGVYCEDCHVAENDDESSAGGVRSYAIEPDIADQLWSISEQMTGESFSA